MARLHEVWVLTPERERAAIQGYQGPDLPPNLHFIHCDLPRRIRPRSPGTTLDYMLHYHLWQIWAYFVARRLHRWHSFDLAHHLTVGAHWKPSLLCLLPIPFVWGPVGGGESMPKSFSRFLGFKGWAYEISRTLVRTLSEMDPLVRITARRAVLALAKTGDTARRLRAMKCRKVQVFSEAGFSESDLAQLSGIPPADDTFGFISVGRLFHWKGFEIGLLAFARIHEEIPRATFTIVGDGPVRQRLEKVARELAVQHKVTFLGKMDRAGTLRKLAESTVLVHPSLHDSGGWVCLEAMAAGRPVICLDLGGPATQVTNETGFKIPATSPQESIEEIARAMSLLAKNPSLVARMGAAGRSHVNKNYSLNQMIRSMANLYHHHVGEARTELQEMHVSV
jgi:glycosyltransferase involved in cell wall biosynthesis